MKYQELRLLIARGQLAPVYLFSGAEEYLKKRAVEEILSLNVPLEYRELNYSVFYGGEASIEAILNICSTPPVMSKKRLVIVKDLPKLSQKALLELKNYLKHPLDTTCLILICPQNYRNAFTRELEKANLRVEFWPLFPREALLWLQGELKNSGKKITPEAAQLLIAKVGKNLEALEGEITKLILFSEQRSVITVQDVEAVVSDLQFSSVFELVSKIFNKELPAAFKILSQLRHTTSHPLLLLGALASAFRRKVKEGEISEKAFLKILREITFADLQLKTTSLPPWSVLESLILKVGRMT